MQNWHLIGQRSILSEIYNDPPLISYKRVFSLKAGYARQSKATKKRLKHKPESHAGLQTPLHWFCSSVITINY